MAYKIPNLPSVKAYKEEMADFWEIQAIRNPSVSVSNLQISKGLGKELDEINHNGIESEDDLLDNTLEDVLIELQKRQKYTANKYPFNFGKFSLRFIGDKKFNEIVYLFLLLCTRFNMKTNKIQNDIDGTLLFEKLCAFVAKKFFGKNSESFVFGTAEPGNFEAKVNDMISRIGEGDSFKNPNNNPPTKNDDSVDVVVWKEFADKRIGKLIAFGQCKTGTSSWRDDKFQLDPQRFCSRWFHQEPVHIPIRILFICDTMLENSNFYTDQQGFLVFNRFRILEYVDDTLDVEIINDILSWVEGALITIDIIE